MDLSCLSSDVAFMPHGHCYYWTPELLWMMVGSDVVIGVSYFAIAAALGVFVRRRSDVPFPRIIRLFGVFILACGVTHFIAAANTWQANYWLEGFFKLCTALVSAYTAIVLFPAIPTALALRSPQELEGKNAELAVANEALAALNHDLNQVVDQLRIANAELDEKNSELDHRNAEFHRLNRELADANAAQQRFVENITHEFRTPLNRVMVPASMLASRHPDDSAIQNAMGDVLGGAQELRRLVDQLLKESAIDEGGATVAEMPVEVVGLCATIVERFRGDARARGVSLEFTSPTAGAAPIVKTDPFYLENILVSVLDNAFQHGMVESGSRVRVQFAWADDVGVLVVEDDGPGIPTAEQEAVLGRFVRGRAAEHAHRRGTGLGLSIVQEFARVLGGGVEVGRSRDLGGAAITIRLRMPCSEGPAVAACATCTRACSLRDMSDTDTPAVVGNPNADTRVLVAEDDRDLARLMASLLSEIGTVEVVYDGDAAWEAIQATPPDVVVSDVRMPGRSGIELCREIRASHLGHSLPIVLVTARSGREAIMEAWDVGADEYVVKPFHPQELLLRVRNLVRGAKARRSSAAATRALAIARETNAELERLAVALSHDLRGPLGNVGTALRMAEREVADGQVDFGLQLVGSAVKKVAHMEHATRDLLLYCRSAWREHPTEAVFLPDVVDAVVSLAATDSGPSIEQRVANEHVPIAHTPLELVLRNLVSNAVKHHHRPHAGTIVVEVRRLPEDVLELRVADDGPGIPATMHDHIFDMFRRGDTQADGSGVGLALVATLVRRHGGRLTLDSDEGAGAVFTVTWPLAIPKPKTAHRRAS